MEGNKLISDFMEVETSNGIVYQDNNTNEFHRIKYHESWDWLIPVVEKCLQTGDNTNEGELIKHQNLISVALNTMDKDKVYDEVIEFIKKYNIDQDDTI
tara:strand:- start:513 stop:809 length:297 start_codon:yes stop_codon:yes gene_type:complete